MENVKIFLIKAPSCNVESVIDRLGLSKLDRVCHNCSAKVELLSVMNRVEKSTPLQFDLLESL